MYLQQAEKKYLRNLTNAIQFLMGSNRASLADGQPQTKAYRQRSGRKLLVVVLSDMHVCTINLTFIAEAPLAVSFCELTPYLRRHIMTSPLYMDL